MEMCLNFDFFDLMVLFVKYNLLYFFVFCDAWCLTKKPLNLLCFLAVFCVYEVNKNNMKNEDFSNETWV